jgi:hypothetical protein
MKLNADCKPFGIGSLPYTSASEAWNKVLEFFPQIPFWPQLSKRSYLENMYIQFSEGLPGLELDLKNQRIFVNIETENQQETEQFFNKYLSEDLDGFKVSRDYCEGIYSGLEIYKENTSSFGSMEFIKGQITGPVSFGLQIIDQEQKPILYNEMYHDIVVKQLQRKARWQEKIISELNKNTIISVDEPYLSSLGSGFINLQRDRVVQDIEAVFSELTGLKAMHCCGNIDWSIITDTSIDILLFDAYDYLKNLLLFSSDIESFLDRGGILGWGIVPTTGEELGKTNVKELLNKLEDGIDALEQKGINKAELLNNSLITPSCGLGNLSIEHAELTMEYTKQISFKIRDKYEMK